MQNKNHGGKAAQGGQTGGGGNGGHGGRGGSPGNGGNGGIGDTGEDGLGGGISVAFGSLTIADDSITGNHANTAAPGGGGGAGLPGFVGGLGGHGGPGGTGHPNGGRGGSGSDGNASAVPGSFGLGALSGSLATGGGLYVGGGSVTLDGATISGNMADNLAENVFVAPGGSLTTITPLSVSSITPVSPDPRNVPVSVIDVNFNEPTSTTSLTPAAVSLTDDGGPNLITGPISLTRIMGDEYAISGLSGLTGAEGEYTLTINADHLKDQDGFPGSGSLSTSWLMDTTPPTSRVSSLPKTGNSLSFPVTVTGTDPNGAGGSTPAGIASFTIYVSTNGGAWTRWTTIAPTSTSGGSASATDTFTGLSNTIYAFYSTATDAAGNTQAYKPSIEASTYLPDLTPPITSVDPTTGTNPSSVDGAGTFTLNLTGRAPGGKPLTYLEVFVGIDLGGGGNTRQIGAAIPAGFPDANGVYHATISYQGLTDSTSHSYTFSSIGIDGAGLVQTAPVNPVTFTNQSFTATSLQVTGLTVENGAAARSYVRYLDVNFNESDTQSGGELTAIAGSLGTSSPDVRLYRYDLNGDASSKTVVSLSGVTASVIDHAIELDFGTAGVGGNANTTAGDGYYELDVTVGGTTSQHHFDRLLGDVNGDGVVNNTDLTDIAEELALSSPTGYTPLGADVNGDGSVTAMDLTLATRAKGDKLGSGLTLG